jgi:hypothetical protein
LGIKTQNLYMKRIRIILIIVIPILGLLGVGLLLCVNNFFVDYKSQTFNEVISPIATIFAIIIYLYTLLEIKKQSKITNNNFQFDFFKEKIEKEKIKLENWKLNLMPYGELEEFADLIAESSGLKYFKLYNSIYQKIKKSDKYWEDLKSGVTINQLDKKEYVSLIYSLFSINFEIYLNNCNIENLLKEINGSELSDFQKKSLNELIIVGILNDYMMIFYDYHTPLKQPVQIQGKWIEFSNNEIIYKTDILTPHSVIDKELKLKSSLKDVEFDRLSHYIFKNKIWK